MKKTKAKNHGRLEMTFAGLRQRGEKALIAFVTAGDPDMAASERIIIELERAGVDIVELGIPFSDPMADGPTIQASSERALKAGATLDGVLSLVRRVRGKSAVPMVLFGYYNPIFVYGPTRFASAAARAGADGVLVVDLPPEESRELRTALSAEGVDLICLLTPTSDEARIRLVTRSAAGFVYYVSVAGVTGARKQLAGSIDKAIKKVRKFTDLPIGVGFGISTPAQAREAARTADGVIVGSAIVNVIARGLNDRKTLPKKVGRFAAGLKRALRRA